jgi:mercuric ion transport protein
LVLITLGVSGAWISNLTLLEPYRPIFIGAAVMALFFAYRRIWRPATSCEPGQVCALPQINRRYKALFWVVVALVIIALGFPLIAPWFY